MKTYDICQWKIARNTPESIEDKKALAQAVSHEHEWIKTSEIGEVHDILLKAGLISNEARENGNAEDLQDIDQYDWIYKAEFIADSQESDYTIRFNGLDTMCDVFFNGTYLGTSESMYLPFVYNITGLISFDHANEIAVYFHNHQKTVKYLEDTMPDEFRGIVPARAMLLKAEDYGMSAATHHGYSPIGIFDSVTVTQTDVMYWNTPEIDVFMNENFKVTDKADVQIKMNGSLCKAGNVKVHISLKDQDGVLAGEDWVDKSFTEGEYCLKSRIVLQDPKLWWPKNYGDHPLYKAEIEYFWNDQPQGIVEKSFGIRIIRKTGNMRFTCNGQHIRFWGGNFAPIYGPSNVFNKEVAFDLIEKADQAGMNAIRVWGPSKPYPDCFYDELDRRGILVWQDFPTGGSALPWNKKYTDLLEDEVRQMILRLKHHPCIYLWCGGNENIYMNEFLEDDRDEGFSILTHNFKTVCEETDPTRYYHPSCPYDGEYTNSPDFGDCHGSRAYRRFIPGEAYGVFYSENIRCYPPQYKSMKRWLGDDIWEDGYVDQKPFGCIKAMPSTWQKLLGNNGEEKLGPVEDFYAAQNAQQLVYKFTAAAGQDLYNMYARSRRGKPAWKAGEENICQGFTLWKFNDPWPNFYCALVDYYGECALTYYAVKRAIKPVWVDLEVADHIYLWGVNDTNTDFNGTAEITAYRMDQKKVIRSLTVPVVLLRDSSRIVMDLDCFGPMHWFTVLNVRLINEEGETVVSNYAYLRKENMLPFPQAKLDMTVNGDILTIRTEDFARCVELSSGEDGMEFGWMFEDNFFDLLPNEEKKVRILKRGTGSCIRAKAQYSDNVTIINL